LTTDPARPLEGRVALVTGASRGIGRATALALAAQGTHCIVTARTVGGLEALDDEIRAAGGQATLLPMDLTAGEDIDRLGPSIAGRFGRLDIFVHAAATLGALSPVTHMRDKDWNAAMAVNLTAGWRLIRTLSPLLEASDAGRAVVLTDPHARADEPFWGMMAASKAGLEALVRSWAAEHARQGRLKVALFQPSPCATRLRAQAMPGEDASALVSPNDVAKWIVTLCHPDSQHVSGKVISETRGAAV